MNINTLYQYLMKVEKTQARVESSKAELEQGNICSVLFCFVLFCSYIKLQNLHDHKYNEVLSADTAKLLYYLSDDIIRELKL